MLADRRRGLVAGAGFIAAAAATMFLVGRHPAAAAPLSSFGPVGHLDARAASLGRELDVGPVHPVALTLNALGYGIVVAFVWFAAAAMLVLRRAWDRFAVVVLTWLGSELSIQPLKDVWHRGRPPDPDFSIGGFAMPSGHAIRGSAVTLALVFAFVPPGRGRRPWLMGAGAFATLMGLSRIVLGVHWLSDVVAGSTLGAGIALLAASIASPRRR